MPATGIATHLNEVWSTLKRITGSRLDPTYGPPRAGDVRHSQADTTDAVRYLGHAPRFSLEEGLRRTFEWYSKMRSKRASARRLCPEPVVAMRMWTETAEGVLESSLLKRLPWLRHGFGTRLSDAWPGEYTHLKQIHSDIVFSADGGQGCVGHGDALVTATPGRLIGIRTADCVPLLFADPKTGSSQQLTPDGAALSARSRGGLWTVCRPITVPLRIESTSQSDLRSENAVLR